MTLMTPALEKQVIRPSWYLAGPIENVTPLVRDGWRDIAGRRLHEMGYDAISPTGKDGWSPEDIVACDLYLMQRCTAVLAWLPPDIVSTGTTMEIWHAAHDLDKPVVVWGQDANRANPWLLHVADVILLSLPAALDFIRQYRWQFQEPHFRVFDTISAEKAAEKEGPD
ncbi:MAG TPA: hypothetical protein VM487_03205 [Phycisphaerae bacterium]|nr:hypothetical protein [Phycisphaerae bacterium]